MKEDWQVYAQPTSIDGADLLVFFGDLVSGITGLGRGLTRRNWQPNPPAMPAIDVDWCGFGIQRQKGIYGPYAKQNTDDMNLARQEEIDLLCSFYGPRCIQNAELFRDGLWMWQNRRNMREAKIGLTDSGDVMHVPELINDKWYDRADIVTTFRRELSRVLPQKTLTSLGPLALASN